MKVVDLFLNSKDINTNIKAASDRSQIHLAPAFIASSARRKDDFHLSEAALVHAVFSTGFDLLLGMDFKGVSFFQASNN